MAIHYWFRCGYNSKRKDTWRRHLHNKKMCSADYLDLPRDLIYKEYKTYLECFMSVLHSSDMYYCGNCKFSSDYKYNMRRHVKDRSCIENHKEIIKQLQNRIERLESIPESTSNIAINKITDDIVNDYGSEDISELTYDIYMKLFQCPSTAISNLVEELHYNIPQNRNIDIPNINGNYIKIKINRKWIFKEYKTILNKLLRCGHNRITDFINENINKLPKKTVKKIKNMLRTAIITEKEIRNHKYKIRNIMINNRHLII